MFAVNVYTEIVFSLIEIADVLAPAEPLGPVIEGALASTITVLEFTDTLPAASVAVAVTVTPVGNALPGV